MEKFFGFWKDVIIQLAMAVCVGLAVLVVCGCCCIPCLKALAVIFINTVIQRGSTASASGQKYAILLMNGGGADHDPDHEEQKN